MKRSSTYGENAVKASGICAAVLLLAFGANAEDQRAMSKQMLEAHNRYRAEVHVPPLTWSAELASRAQKWAQALIEQNAFGHQHGKLGENLFEISGAAVTAAEVVAAWASERADYNHQANQCRRVCGHYTQVVWRDTKRLGCGVAREARREVWVCDYAPPGNVMGERPY